MRNRLALKELNVPKFKAETSDKFCRFSQINFINVRINIKRVLIHVKIINPKKTFVLP